MNPGTRLGPYEIVSLLGAGGMGEVYRARDSRLQRDVAIKVLPASFVHDATRRARFERETRAVAALSHTNILAIFDTGVHDGHVFAVTELLDGDTLRARLDSGPLPVKKAIDIGTQVARGLSAAHDKGIVHRDLKPENVFLLRNGQVKILDFGLATTSTSSSSGGANATVTAMTVPGTVMGTVGYMAPEQVRGLTLDARTDLFALGAVLYEMLTGTRAFRGNTPADVASAILCEEPPEMASLRNDLPPALEPIVRHCLERTPADRFQSAHDVAFALATLSGSTVAATTPQPTPVRRVTPSTMTVAAACVAGGVLAGVLITMAASRGRAAVPPSAAERRPAPVLRTAINLPAAAPLAIGSSLTQVGFDNPAVALSPDGMYLAYVSRSGQSTALSLVELTTGQVRTLPGTEGATHSFFSPDSQQLGFLTLDRVKRVAVQGGAIRTLCQALRPSVARWTADNVVYFSENGYAASRVGADGGRPERIRSQGAWSISDFTPDGKSILVTARTGINSDHAKVMVVNLSTGEGTTVVPSAFGARFVARDYLLFGRAGSLYAARVDASLNRVTGDPVLIADGVAMDSLGAHLHAIASDAGLLAFVSGGNAAIGRPTWVNRAGAAEPVDMAPQVYGAPVLAPGARQFAVQVGDAVDHIWIQNLDRRGGRKLASSVNAGWPAWSPDGRRIAVRAWPVGQGLEQGSIEIWDVDGNLAAQPLAGSKGGYPGSWSTPAGVIAAHLRSGSETARVRFFPQTGAFAPEGFPGDFPSMSPDGRWVAYASNETGTAEIFIRSMPDGKVKRQVSSGGGEPIWNENGELFYRFGRRWFATRVTTQPELGWNPDPPRVVFETDFVDTPGVSYDVSPDGQRLLIVKPAGPPVVQSQISLIANWPGIVK